VFSREHPPYGRYSYPIQLVTVASRSATEVIWITQVDGRRRPQPGGRRLAESSRPRGVSGRHPPAPGERQAMGTRRLAGPSGARTRATPGTRGVPGDPTGERQRARGWLPEMGGAGPRGGARGPDPPLSPAVVSPVGVAGGTTVTPPRRRRHPPAVPAPLRAVPGGTSATPWRRQRRSAPPAPFPGAPAPPPGGASAALRHPRRHRRYPAVLPNASRW
jgi:hypothetical protein